MSKTITIIELFNRIAKGEEVPEKIKIYEYVFKLNKDIEHYYNEYVEITDLINHNFSNLNDAVEILEDEETIDINDIEELELYSDDGVECYDKADVHKQGKKINEIIRYLKQINKLEER